MSISKPIVSTLARAIPSAIATKRRYYTIFDPGYVDLVTPWVASGDFEIELRFVITSIARKNIASGSDYIELNAVGQLEYSIGGGARNPALPGNPFDGQVHVVNISRAGSVQTLTYDGDVVLSDTINTNQLSYSYFATDFAQNFDGIIYNVSLKDLDNPPNSKDIPLDTDSLTIARETLNADGAELWEAPFIVPTPWTDNGDGSFTLDGSLGSASLTTDPTISTSANPVKVKLTATGITSSAILFGTSGDTYQIAEDGTHEFIAVDCGNVGFRRRFSSSVGTISNISIKETTDALYVDVQAEDKVQELP